MIKKIFTSTELSENVLTSTWDSVKSGLASIASAINRSKDYYSSEHYEKTGMNKYDSILEIINKLDNVADKYSRLVPKDAIRSIQKALYILHERGKIKTIRLIVDNIDNDASKEIVIQTETASGDWMIGVDEISTTVVKSRAGENSKDRAVIEYKTKTFGVVGATVQKPTMEIFSTVLKMLG